MLFFKRRSVRLMILWSLVIGVGSTLLKMMGAPETLFWLCIGSGNFILGGWYRSAQLREDGWIL